MSASTINIAPASALAISNVRCSGPKKKRITCGTTRPTKPIEPAMLTMVAVISAAVVKRIRRTRGTAIPSEAAASSPKVNASSARAYHRQTARPASTTTMTSWNSGQRTPLKLPSSQNITSRACCALAEVLMV